MRKHQPLTFHILWEFVKRKLRALALRILTIDCPPTPQTPNVIRHERSNCSSRLCFPRRRCGVIAQTCGGYVETRERPRSNPGVSHYPCLYFKGTVKRNSLRLGDVTQALTEFLHHWNTCWAAALALLPVGIKNSQSSNIWQKSNK